MNPFKQTSEAGSLNTFSERLGVGEHVVAVDYLEYKPAFNKKLNDKYGMSSIEYVVVESSVHKPNERRGDAWHIGNPGTSGENNRKRFNQFGQALTEAINGDPTKVEAVAKNLEAMTEFDENLGRSKTAGRKFPGRGVLLRVTTTSRKGKDGVEYINNIYSPVTQTKEQITARRAQLEAVPKKEEKPSTPAATTTETNSLDSLGL